MCSYFFALHQFQCEQVWSIRAESAYILTWPCSNRGWILWFSVKWGKLQKTRCWLSTNNSLRTISLPSQYIIYIFYETFNELYCRIQKPEKDLSLWFLSLPLKYPSYVGSLLYKKSTFQQYFISHNLLISLMS